jgi:dTMP kinase
VFVSFEGLDGSGKTTQAVLARSFLAEQGRETVATREPGGTRLGEAIREILLDGAEMTPWAEAALFAAARAELVVEVIKPALDRGADVLSDRYLDSSLAYQGIARGLGVDAILGLNWSGIGGLLPDRTFLLLVDPEESLRRGEGEPDRIEREGLAFRVLVDGGYRRLAELYPDRIVAIDGSLRPVDVARIVHGHLRELS